MCNYVKISRFHWENMYKMSSRWGTIAITCNSDLGICFVVFVILEACLYVELETDTFTFIHNTLVMHD